MKYLVFVQYEKDNKISLDQDFSLSLGGE